MKIITGGFCTVLTFYFTLFFNCSVASADITILKNGGGAPLIENTLVAVTVSVSQGADYLALPINMSADDHLIVFKDTTLNRLTDVADLFPMRSRNDGNYYVVDFDLGELRQLRLRNVFESDSNSLSLGIPTLNEALTLVRSLNTLLDKNTGVVLTLQDPPFYNNEGKNLNRALQQVLQQLSYTPKDKLFIECSDPDELQKISRWPATENGDRFALIQHINTQQNQDADQPRQTPIIYQHDWLFTNSGLRILASYADAVALPSEFVAKDNAPAEHIITSLRNYGINIFLQTESNQQKSNVEESRLSFSQADSSLSKEVSFDGRYLDSIKPNPPQEAKNDPPSMSDLNSESQIEKSTLPPFFSNLGLSQPDNSKRSLKNDQDEEEKNLPEELR